MISRLLGGAMPWLLAALIGLLVLQYQQLQHADAEKEAAELKADHEQERATILIENQRQQREQLKALNAALTARDQTLSAIADDIRASNTALEELGEQNAEIRAWLDRDVPGGVADWVRELQQSTASDGVRLPDSPEPPDE